MPDKTLTRRQFKQLKKLAGIAQSEWAAYDRTRKLIVEILPPYIGTAGAVDTVARNDAENLSVHDLMQWFKLKVKRK